MGEAEGIARLSDAAGGRAAHSLSDGFALNGENFDFVNRTFICFHQSQLD
jgi:hypothetical protein